MVNIIKIYLNKRIIYGNNKQILLEQLEQAGISIPYSCRVGICGYCKIELIKGKVSALKRSAIINSKILCCSCIPQTSLELGL